MSLVNFGLNSYLSGVQVLAELSTETIITIPPASLYLTVHPISSENARNIAQEILHLMDICKGMF